MDSENKQMFIYKDVNGEINVRTFMKDETLWLTQKSMAELFDVDRSVISKHISNIYKEGELAENLVCAYFAHTAEDGKQYRTAFYNLDMIIAVGYRVNSAKATAFRIWATSVLKEYIIKGFALDDNRLKNGRQFNKAHFRELLDRIKEIRTSERMLYQQLKDIYALSEDYSHSNAESLIFFAKVQNKVHYAITGQTSAEIIVTRANADKKNMGLTTWKNSPDGRITKSDVITAKNYLEKREMEDLRDIVNMFLDYAEMQAERNIPMTMQDWSEKLNSFLTFMDYDVLQDAGKVSAEIAKLHAESEFEKYRIIQDKLYVSDFDRFLELEQKSAVSAEQDKNE